MAARQFVAKLTRKNLVKAYDMYEAVEIRALKAHSASSMEMLLVGVLKTRIPIR